MTVFVKDTCSSNHCEAKSSSSMSLYFLLPNSQGQMLIFFFSLMESNFSELLFNIIVLLKDCFLGQETVSNNSMKRK